MVNKKDVKAMRQLPTSIKRALLSLFTLLTAVAAVRAQDMTATPLTFEAVEAGTINIVNPNALTIEYSKNGGGWTAANSDPISITVGAGDVVLFRGDNPAYGTFDMMTGEQYTRFTATNDVYVYGNVMSLISSAGYSTLTTLERVGGSDEWDMDINLAFLFSTPEDDSNWAPKNNTTIRNHPTKDIVLPATNVTRSGYMYMFAGCQGLTRAPELPATDLSTGCYHRMFDSCTSLEKAPVLAAATVPVSGYSCMFYGCAKLNYVKCLATDISAEDCTGGWLTGVAAEGIFIKAEGMNDWTVGPQGKWNEVNGIPAGWGISSEMPLTLEAAEAGTINIVNPKGLTIEWSKDGATWTADSSNPISISVTAGDQVRLRGDNACYGGNASGAPTHITATNNVFVYGNIMSLVHKDDFATNNTLTAENVFCELFFTENANTTIKSHPTKELLLPATSLPMTAYMYMFANCQGLTRAPELPAMTLGPVCYHRMFGDCTSLAVAPKLPATTLADECYFSMFDGCTALTTAPELPATTLAAGCYSEMFAHCTALTKAPVLLAPTLANNCYEGMFDGCSKLSYVKCLATDLGAKFNDFYTSTHRWLDGVSPTGTFVKAVGMDGWLTDTGDGIPAGWTVKDGTDFDPAKTPLTIEATEDATTVTIDNPLRLSIGYDKYDSAGNLMLSASSSGTTITIDGLNAGYYVQLNSNNSAYSDGTSVGSTRISADKAHYAYGNVMSLVSSDAFASNTTLTADNAFYHLFYQDTELKNHPSKELVLPATTLTENCYGGMFYGCTSLTKAFELPATTLATKCYRFMYSGCSSLTTACELPATTLTEECYSAMFQGTALTASPALPATTLAKGCYMNMFRVCNQLTQASALPATVMAESCYEYMFLTTALTEAPALPATTLAKRCYFAMFGNIKTLTQAPALPATALDEQCYSAMFWLSGLASIPNLPATDVPELAYSQMFQGCNSLTSVPALTAQTVGKLGYRWMFKECEGLTTSPAIQATTLGEDACYFMFQNCTNLKTAGDIAATDLGLACCEFMFSGCSNLTKAPALPATTLSTQCYQRMFEECHSLVTAPELPATKLAELCYNDMFWNCTALKNAPVLPATTLADYCYTMMFLGCSSLETAPDLPAATLTPGCYEHMFMNCTALNYVRCLATDLGDDSSTDGWLTNVAPTGTFVKATGTDWSTKGVTVRPDEENPDVNITFVHGIPAGWTVQEDPTIVLAAYSVDATDYFTSFYSTDDDYAVSSDVTAYTGSVEGQTLKLMPLTAGIIPAGTAVVLKATGPSITLTPSTAAASPISGNDLKGVDVNTPCEAGANYVLSDETGTMGFYLYTGTTLTAHKAYLPKASVPSGTPGLRFIFGDATGIQAPDSEETGTDAIYNLQGQRAGGLQKGMNIVGGKKILVRRR